MFFSMHLRVNGGHCNDFEHKRDYQLIVRKKLKCIKIVTFHCNKRLSLKRAPEKCPRASLGFFSKSFTIKSLKIIKSQTQR